jgi:molybdate transport system regulatory protein
MPSSNASDKPARPTRIKLAVYIGADEHKVGPGKVALLEEIGRHGSISAAARAMGMAYRHAWEMVDDLNGCFARPVVRVAIGGRTGGGAELTPWGRELIERFRAIETLTQQTIGPAVADLAACAARKSARGPTTAGSRPTRRRT